MLIGRLFLQQIVYGNHKSKEFLRDWSKIIGGGGGGGAGAGEGVGMGVWGTGGGGGGGGGGAGAE